MSLWTNGMVDNTRECKINQQENITLISHLSNCLLLINLSDNTKRKTVERKKAQDSESIKDRELVSHVTSQSGTGNVRDWGYEDWGYEDWEWRVYTEYTNVYKNC